jgi:hypothetical protein
MENKETITTEFRIVETVYGDIKRYHPEYKSAVSEKWIKLNNSFETIEEAIECKNKLIQEHQIITEINYYYGV